MPSMSETGYNGWQNYETWCVGLWIDNDEGTQERAREITREAQREGRTHVNVRQGIWTVERATVYVLADALKGWVRDEPEDEGGLLPDLGATLAADLLGAALDEVDWQEIAEHYLADAPADTGADEEDDAAEREE
jgi:hypothetical protein